MAIELPKKIVSTLVVNVIAVIVFLILVGNMVLLYSGMETVRTAEKSVARTYEILSELEQVISLMKDAETAMRGYVIAGDNRFLEPYTYARRDLPGEIRKIKVLFAENAAQLKRTENVENQIIELLRWDAEVIETRRRGDFLGANKLVASGFGKERMDDVRQVIQDIRHAEQQLLAQRVEMSRVSSTQVDRSFVFSSIVTLLLVFLTHFFVRRFLVQQIVDSDRLTRENWQQTGLSGLNDALRGEQLVTGIGQRSLAFFSQYVGVQIGTVYTVNGDYLERVAVLAKAGLDSTPKHLQWGETLAGEAVRQKRMIHMRDVPPTYSRVSSTLGDAPPKELVILPLMFENIVTGVMELATLQPFSERDLKLFERVSEMLGVTISTANSRARLQELLEETQRQAEELQVQQEELRVSNDVLEIRARDLKQSQERLQTQQEELRQTNEELEQQAAALEVNRQSLSKQNAALEAAKLITDQKSRALEAASRYKSEFLANMSHELRTPLNSLLILASLLSENKEGNLTDKQLDFTKTIYKAGSDLLALISDILDLSKVEAGKLEIVSEAIDLNEFARILDTDFRHLAEQKSLTFSTEVAEGLAPAIYSDRKRVEQIVRNLIANAIKFTSKGGVEVEFHAGKKDQTIAISVHDSGIGIPKDKQELIFEAFQQADGSTSRSFGGTGLGLTISRKLAHLLGGEIEVSSKPGSGSVFTLTIPMEFTDVVPISEPVSKQIVMDPVQAQALQLQKLRDASQFLSGDLNDQNKNRHVLIIEDDKTFGEVLMEIARGLGFSAVLATEGEAGLTYAFANPVGAILLDIKLPDLSGLVVLERLKSNSSTRHIPIHVVSGGNYSQNALSLGAIGVLKKPARKEDIEDMFASIQSLLDKKVKYVLIIEDDKIQREAIKELLGNGDIKIFEADNGADAIKKISTITFDCVILDLRLPDMTGFELLERMAQQTKDQMPPVVVYTGKDLSKDEQDQLLKYSESIIIKGVRSPERLIDEVSLFLHRVESRLPPDGQALLHKLRADALVLKDRRVLVVDDDMRNVFALVNALEVNGIKAVVGRNGREAIEQLDKDPDIELVLMDIMMPEMDGYEAMSIIRKDRRFNKLPIIALTAKAMKGDQEQCLAAGANDYMAKPVNLDRLLSLLKVWLPPKA